MGEERPGVRIGEVRSGSLAGSLSSGLAPCGSVLPNGMRHRRQRRRGRFLHRIVRDRCAPRHRTNASCSMHLSFSAWHLPELAAQMCGPVMVMSVRRLCGPTRPAPHGLSWSCGTSSPGLDLHCRSKVNILGSRRGVAPFADVRGAPSRSRPMPPPPPHFVHIDCGAIDWCSGVPVCWLGRQRYAVSDIHTA